MASVLASTEILRRLELGDLFERDTYDEHNVRGASYDIRVAPDLLRIPKRDFYPRGKGHPGAFVLAPGDVAFVTSMEEFCLAHDLTANIGIRFGFVNKGLLVHTGLIVDPGYGRDVPRGEWGNKRLHFLILNLSDLPQPIQPGDKIVSIQFLELIGHPRPHAADQPAGQPELERRYFERKEQLGLSYITELQQLRRLGERIENVEGTSRDLIQFGVFITAAAFLGIAFAQILTYLGDAANQQALVRVLNDTRISFTQLIGLVIVSLFGLFILRFLLDLVGKVLHWTLGAFRKAWVNFQALTWVSITGKSRSVGKGVIRWLKQFFGRP